MLKSFFFLIFDRLIPEAGVEPARLAALHFECSVSAIPPLGQNLLEAATGIEPVIKVLQTSALPLGYAANIFLERKTGFEPATPTLARLYSTTELLSQEWLG